MEIITEQTQPTINPDLQAKILQKQQERQRTFTKLRNAPVLDQKALSIVQLPFKELRDKLQHRELSSSEALNAFTAKALDITDKCNCVTEFIPEAFEWASILDKEPTSVVRPLRGLPVAIKDDHDVEGLDTTLGLAKNLYRPAREHAVLVKVLLKLGAIPFVKTNVPQSLFSNGSDNPIFGTTLNPINPKLAPGGSSSGSACIVAAGGAPFATGSDLGGSLRTPSHFLGICSLRPTANRLSDKGVAQCLPELTFLRMAVSNEHFWIWVVPGVPGIISPDAETLSYVWRAITEENIQNRFDRMAVPIPWNENLFSSTKKLKIGYFTSLPFFPPFEATQATVLAAKHAFQSNGHLLIDFSMPDDFHYLKTICDLTMADQGRYLKKLFEGEPISYCVTELVESIRRRSNCEKKSDNDDNGKRLNMTRREKILSGDGGATVKSAEDLWNIANEKRLLTQDILGRMEKAGIDLILCPAFPFPALKLHHGYGLSGIVYTIIWSFINFPAGVVRFGTETGSDFLGYDDENDPVLKSAKEAISDSAGMPINIQIVGKPFQEELVLRAMVELEKIRES